MVQQLCAFQRNSFLWILLWKPFWKTRDWDSRWLMADWLNQETSNLHQFVCHLLETALDAHYGHKPDLIRWISAGRICDFPAQDYCGFTHTHMISLIILLNCFIVLPRHSKLGDFFLNPLLHDGNNKKYSYDKKKWRIMVTEKRSRLI